MNNLTQGILQMNNTMKKTVLSVFAALLILGSDSKVAAQEVEFGVRYNPEFTGLLNKNDDNAGSALTPTSNFGYFSFGAGTIIYFDSNVGVAIDLLFSREGQRFSGNFNGGPPDPATYASIVHTQTNLNNIVIAGGYVAKAELNYVKLPIMVSLTSDNSRPLFLTLLAGPQINFLQSVAQEVNHTDTDYPASSVVPQDLYKSVTIDGVVAVGIACRASTHMVLSARLRFDYGFGDVEKKDVMVSYSGAAPVLFYSADRQPTHSITGALMLGMDFIL